MKIDYDNYKNDLINVLKNSKSFKDYNYTGSNINILLDILSRNAHNYGFYTNMLIRESSPMTAQRLESLQGYATRYSYLIKNNSAASIELFISVKVSPEINIVNINKNTKFSSVNEFEQSVTFITLDNFSLTEKDIDGNLYGKIIVHQGELKSDIFEVNHLSKFYKINDTKIDIDTLKVAVKNSISGDYGADYNLVNSNIIPNRYDNIFYITLNGMYYDIYFGDDVFGKQPKQGQFIKIEYLKTMGSMGNGATDFRFLKKSSINDKSVLDYYSDVTVLSSEQSSGGYTDINKDNLKLALANFSRVKSIAINDEDYKSIILGEYSDIDSIAVWGGEKNDYRQYGKLFISIKPKYGRYLSTTVKEDIRNFIVKNYSLLATNIMFVDPQYVIINIQIVFNKNNNTRNADNTTIQSDLILQSKLYNDDILGKFDLSYIESDFIEYIGNNYKNGYTNLYIRKELEYKLQLIFGNGRTYEFDFKNPLLKFKSETFLIDGVESYYIYDKDQETISDISLVIGNIKFKNHGSVNLTTGEIELVIPDSMLINEITLYATPVDNSIEANYDRILQIGTIDVEVK